MNPQQPSILPPAQQQAAPTNADPSQFGEYSDWAKGELAKGFTPEQLHQHLQQNGVDVSGNGGNGGGNWFTHLLPTIGGIGGSLLGGLATAGLGGEFVGGAGGSAAGKALENAIEGKKVLDSSDVTAGIEGGIGAGVGGVAGKFLGKAGDFLGNTAKGIVEKEGQTAANAATKAGIEDTATAYKDVSPELQKLYNAKDSLTHAGNMGFDANVPDNLVHVGQTSNDVLNDVLDRSLANSGPVDLSHYPQIIKDALAEQGGTLGSFDKVALSGKRLTQANTPAAKLLNQLEDLGAGTAKTNADPNELRTLTTKLGQLAQDAKPTISMKTGAIDPEQRAAYNVINKVRDQVKSALYDRPEVNAALGKETGNLTAEDVGSQQLADHLNGIITAAGKGDSTAQDLLSEMSRNINVKNFGQEGQNVAQIVTSKGAQDRALGEAGIGPEEEAGQGSNPAALLAHVANPHTGIMSKAAAGVAHAAQNPAILDTMARIGGLGEKLAPAAGVALATSPNLAADPVAMAGGAPGAAAGGTNQGNTNMQTGGNDLQSMVNAMEAQSILAPNLAGASGATSFMQALAPMLQKNRLAATTMGAMPESYANAGGAQGFGGILSRITGLIPGTAAHQYTAEQQQVAQALGIDPAMLPGLMQNGPTAGISSGILGGMQGQLAY